MTQKTLPERLAATLSDYTGEPVSVTDIRLYRDPKVAGCVAVRVVGSEGPSDYLFTRGNFDSAEEVEEAEFTSWPPTSGAPKFFT